MRQLEEERDRLKEELNEDMPVEIQGMQMVIAVSGSIPCRSHSVLKRFAGSGREQSVEGGAVRGDR